MRTVMDSEMSVKSSDGDVQNVMSSVLIGAGGVGELIRGIDDKMRIRMRFIPDNVI